MGVKLAHSQPKYKNRESAYTWRITSIVSSETWNRKTCSKDSIYKRNAYIIWVENL